jgi:hypothetical protein
MLSRSLRHCLANPHRFKPYNPPIVYMANHCKDDVQLIESSHYFTTDRASSKPKSKSKFLLISCLRLTPKAQLLLNEQPRGLFQIGLLMNRSLSMITSTIGSPRFAGNITTLCNSPFPTLSIVSSCNKNNNNNSTFSSSKRRDHEPLLSTLYIESWIDKIVGVGVDNSRIHTRATLYVDADVHLETTSNTKSDFNSKQTKFYESCGIF